MLAMGWIWSLLLVAQAWAWPPFLDGSEIRVVSPDLVRVHAVGTIGSEGLVLQGIVPPKGTPLRILVFPPSAASRSASSAAGDEATPRVVRAFVGEEGQVWLSSDDGSIDVRWSDLLLESGRTLTWTPAR